LDSRLVEAVGKIHDMSPKNKILDLLTSSLLSLIPKSDNRGKVVIKSLG